MRIAYTILIRKPGGKRPLCKSMRKWKDSLKMNLKEVGCEGVDVTPIRNKWRSALNSVMDLHKSGVFIDQLSEY
jgi:hypothetical protein